MQYYCTVMFSRLFVESGLSLDRLRALVEVGAAGSIARAADNDPVRQSQYSRQIKELEDFFCTRLIERQGRGSRLTSSGRELSRISRFFLMGLSNFQRGCLAAEQRFTVAAGASFIRQFLLPALSAPPLQGGGASYAVEVAGGQEIERRLHDLTLDFGVVEHAALSRPLQTRALGEWRLELWMPKTLRLSEARAQQAFDRQDLPLVVAGKELESAGVRLSPGYEARLLCDSFLEARAALEGEKVAALLPVFLAPGKASRSFVRVRIPDIDGRVLHYYLAWNPRLLRLNPHAARRRDRLAESLSRQLAG